MRSWIRVTGLGGVMIVVGAVATALSSDGARDVGPTAAALTGVIALSVGGSVLASGLVARLVSRQVFGLDFSEAVEALRGSSPLTRSNQSLEITLNLEGDGVRASAEHRFSLHEASYRRKRLVFQLYTDIARWGSAGGFASVVEPDGTVLEGDDLGRYLKEESGKVRFEKPYVFHPKAPSTFIVETFGVFRRSDRLIWTVEHISSDFRVRINDCTGLDGIVDVKVNHHREAEIVTNMSRRPAKQGTTIEFAYLGEILPYQGFELQWALAAAVVPSI